RPLARALPRPRGRRTGREAPRREATARGGNEPTARTCRAFFVATENRRPSVRLANPSQDHGGVPQTRTPSRYAVMVHVRNFEQAPPGQTSHSACVPPSGAYE